MERWKELRSRKKTSFMRSVAKPRGSRRKYHVLTGKPPGITSKIAEYEWRRAR
jgi:hypothetical protein